jgi:steroid 5-alpha reductase family enzyme
LLINFLLVKVSGVPMLEQDIAERRPSYRNYILSTSSFIPRRPRSLSP